MKLCRYKQELYDIQEELSSGKKSIKESIDDIVIIFSDVLALKDVDHLECYVQYELIVKFFLSLIEKEGLEKNKIYIYALEKIMSAFSFKKEKNLDGWHSVKRKLSFDVFDQLLTFCENGICPKIKNEYIYCLSDISINGYIRERAHYYSVDGIGIDDNNRHYMAIEKINKVLNCSRCNIEINKTIFQEDFNQTKFSHKEASRNRKSFWIYLTRPLDDPRRNYCDACSFFERQYFFDEKKEIEKYKELIVSNRDKANAIDLFRLCSMRQNF